MVVYANDILKKEVMQMWKICFGDSDDFMEMYFRTKYRNENTLVKVVDGKAVASLQMLPYEMTFGKNSISTAYISGACTLPEERKKGYMDELLNVSFTEMKKRNISVTTLIPQEDWLVGFYEKFGYTEMFDIREQKIRLPEYVKNIGFEVKQATMDDVLLVAEYCNRIVENQDLTIQKTINDWKAVFEDYFLANGKIFIASNQNKISGVCFVTQNNNSLFIKNLLFDNLAAKEILLSFIGKFYTTSKAILISNEGGNDSEPLGMARIIDAEKIISLYAEKYPDLKFIIKVIDKQSAWNNKTYCIDSRKCIISTNLKPDFEVSINLLTRLLFGYRIDELSEEYSIFPTESAVMSLMME